MGKQSVPVLMLMLIGLLHIECEDPGTTIIKVLRWLRMNLKELEKDITNTAIFKPTLMTITIYVTDV